MAAGSAGEPQRVGLESRQELALGKAQKARLVWADLLEIDVVVAGRQGCFDRGKMGSRIRTVRGRAPMGQILPATRRGRPADGHAADARPPASRSLVCPGHGCFVVRADQPATRLGRQPGRGGVAGRDVDRRQGLGQGVDASFADVRFVGNWILALALAGLILERAVRQRIELS